jgi:uncharacterized protein
MSSRTVHDRHTVEVELDVPAEMRDGTILRANVYRPSGPGPSPTLLVRTAYGKDSQGVLGLLDPVQAAREGFLVVVQDVRGRFSSGGQFVAFKYERQDGYDSVEWAAQLPGSNGRVGMYGESYLGNTQLAAAIERPPSLRAIAPALTWCDPMDGMFARGGALELGLALRWSLLEGVPELLRTSSSEKELFQRISSLIDEFDRITVGAYWELPVEPSAALERHGVPDLGGFGAIRDDRVPAWSTIEGRHVDIQVPCLYTGGWYDVFLQGTLDNYTSTVSAGGEATLVVGPWSHTEFGERVGDLRFGLKAARYGLPTDESGNVADQQLAWLRRHVGDPQVQGAAGTPAPVRIFVMGRNEWRTEETWPPARAVAERRYLTANATLAPRALTLAEGSVTFVYDPDDPVPTLGGSTEMSSPFPPGAKDQREIEARPDVLTFTSEPVETELEVTGRIRAVLHCRSSAPSTDWVVRLCDVYPDGRSINICDGILRVLDDAQEVGRHEIDLWSTSIVFLPGHRLRVQVTSSSFPRWDRNLGTGHQDRIDRWPAEQTIYLDPDRPSFIELPVVPPL